MAALASADAHLDSQQDAVKIMLHLGSIFLSEALEILCHPLLSLLKPFDL